MENEKSYFVQINRALMTIEDNIYSDISMDTLALAAGISKWYFQKIFQAMVGETVKEYISIRRLSLAALLLLTNPKISILDVAVAHQFESHEVFTRAFKRVFKLTPSEFRIHQNALQLIPQKPKVTLDYISHLYAGVSMEPVIVQLAEKKIMGLSGAIGSIQDSLANNKTIIASLWAHVETCLAKEEILILNEKIGLVLTNGGTSSEVSLEYFAGFIIEENLSMPQNFIVNSIAAGDYAEFKHKGPMSFIDKTYAYIYGSWLPRSNYRRGDGPEFAIYPRSFNPQSQDLEVKLFIPIIRP